MMRGLQRFLGVLVILSMLLGVIPSSALANPPLPDDPRPGGGTDALPPVPYVVKPMDQPNPKDYQANAERQRLKEAGQSVQADTMALAGTDRVLVVMVEFAGTDVFTWTAPTVPSDYTTGSMWDPYGRVDSSQAVVNPGTGAAIAGDCSKIITQTTVFTYGPTLHNTIPRPASAADADAGNSTWTADFSPSWFRGFMFGDGITINYQRTDGSQVNADFTGKSVKQYFQDFSGGAYNINGDVVGWVQVPHSAWWYGGDSCPGAISGGSSSLADGKIPGGGTPRTLVKDTLDAVNAISNTIPGFNWADYDLNGDGVIDRLWIIHAGYGEEESTVLNRTSYGESAVWSHSSSISPNYQVAPGVKAGAYIIMPENGGIGVFAHEYAHNLGAKDLYAYGLGNTSAGFWALQSDDWTGYPIGFQPPSPDPLHLDNWGWLNPKVVFDPNQVYQVNLGQASNFPGGAGVYRSAKIQLPNGSTPLPVTPWAGSYFWWGGKLDLANGMMTSNSAIALTSGTTATLAFDITWDIEDQWDWLWVQLSADGGATWNTLTNTVSTAGTNGNSTSCIHDPDWIGGLYGFPDDLCAAGLGGYTGLSAGFPNSQRQTLDLTPYVNQSVKLRFWYMTDSATTGAGPFVDNVVVGVGGAPVFADNAESGDANWTYTAPWVRSDGTQSFTQNYYLQWRNVGSDGGYDSALGDSRWRYGPANTGLVVWYNNNFYNDNEIYNYLEDGPSFGPKGKMLVIDSHPDPIRNPASPFPNAIANWTSRSQMRDAPFSLQNTVGFTYPMNTGTWYTGRPAVSMFQDASSYYPGLEYALRGPSPCVNKYWFESQWDASAVVPARNLYTTKTSGGTGLTTGTGIRMRGAANPAGICGSAWYGYWYVPYADPLNSGNPIDSSVDFGWRVQILSQTSQTATVKIWNTHYRGALSADKTLATSSETINYAYSVPVNDGSGMSLFSCVDLDSTKVSYVAGSVTNGAMPLTGPCGSTSGVAAIGPAADVQSIGWTGYIEHGAAANFSFSVKPKSFNFAVALQAKLFLDGVLRDTVPAQPVSILPAYKLWMPLVFRQ
jgi:immune inhibitor A